MMPSTVQSKNIRSLLKQQEIQRFPLHDDQETKTNFTLSNEPVIQRMQRKLVLLQPTITK